MKKLFVTAIAVVLLSTIVSCESKPVYFTIAPTSHNFGQVNIGDTATFDFVVTNKKSVDMTLTTISFTTGEFSEITGAQGQIIVAKGSMTITVRFAPALPGGSKEDTMTIEWTDVNAKTGTKNVKLKGEAVPVPLIDAPTSYDFGTVGIGQTATHNFNISNTGTADLILSLFNFNGNATLFSITVGGVTPVTIIPGATHTVTVQFAPVATGSFPTVLEITHNAVNAVPPASINIVAAGGGGRIEFNQTSPWDFGEVKTGGSTTDVLEISNTGSINLNIQSITLVNGTIFTIDSIEDSSGNPIAAPFGIAPSDFVELAIKFSPTTDGNLDDTLEIENDGSYASSPAQLVIEGIGRAPIVQTINYTGAIVNWNVPVGVTSGTIEVWGAQGARAQGGKGARMKGDFVLNPGETLKVLVGQKGTDGDNTRTYLGGGGGGGSFVTKSNNDPMIIAGGGGGYTNYGLTTTMDGRSTTDGGDTYNAGGGTNGNGGRSGETNGPAAGGGGLLTDGGSATSCEGGKSFLNGGAGGLGTPTNWFGGNGGFGGGGGGYCQSNVYNRSGGGGGYSGGQGGTWSGQQSGGGGGSINNGTSQSNTAGVRTGNGLVELSY